MIVRIGRNQEGAEAVWHNAAETVSVVKSFHDPPRYVVFTRPYKGDQWLKDDDFASYGIAEKHAKRLAKRET